MICRRCVEPMQRLYRSTYKCWAWECPICKYARCIAPDNQLSLEHEKGWR